MSEPRVELHLRDCLEVMRGMADGCVDMVVTDPPYGINTKSDGTGKLNPWADLCNSAFWYTAWIGECRRILKPTGCLWSFLNWRSLVTFQKATCDARWSIESLLVWDKEWIGPTGPKQLRPSYEMVALWAMPDFVIRDRSLPDVVRVQWSSHKPSGHPAEKPKALISKLVNWSANSTPISGQFRSNSALVILDPFMGSGTTGEVAIELGHHFIGCEIDPGWHTAAARRIGEARAMPPLFRQASTRQAPLFPAEDVA